MNSLPTEIEPHQIVYQRLLDALQHKTPLPPPEWDLVKLEEEILRATKEYNPDPTARFIDAAATAIYYLADFSYRLPVWIDVSTDNKRAVEMCEEIAAEIERVTFRPDEVIAERGKLKSWLKAILAVQTCFISREETERAIVRNKAAKHASSVGVNNREKEALRSNKEIRQNKIAESIWQKAQNGAAHAKPTFSKTPAASEQPSLF